MARLSFSRFKSLTYGCQYESLVRGFKGNLATETGKLVESLATGAVNDINMEEYFLNKSGATNSAFEKANILAQKLKANSDFQKLLKFKQQVKCEVLIRGVDYLGYADFYDEDTKTVWDLKTVKDFKSAWNEEHRAFLPFHVNAKYQMQGAIYTRALQAEHFNLIVISKATGEIRIFEYLQHVLDDAMEVLEEGTQLAADILDLKVEPIRCESCESCIESRTTTRREVIDC